MRLALAAALLCAAAVCAHAEVASWYGPGFSGRRTASGEKFDPNAMTAAMRSPVPFGTRVRVTNQRNGRSIVVRVNDRGPFVRGRAIDLTAAGASRLGFSGLARVTIEFIGQGRQYVPKHGDFGFF